MTDPRDDLDVWLHAEVEPIHPPPGTFERIRKQARRRKRRRALVAAASAGAVAVVTVLAVVALPRVVPSVLHLKKTPAGNSTSFRPSSHVATSPPTPDASPPSTPPSQLPPVPANFAPTSVTFVGQDTGWVIGQAGTPGHCFNGYICTSVARTDDYGRTWYGVPAPVTGAPHGSTGVGQIRFLNTLDGWAFGPELWATHDGGQQWTPVGTYGLRVTSLETVGSEAFAVFARCTGTRADFAAACTRFYLYSTPAGSDAWRPVPGLPGGGFGAPGGGASSAAVVLTGSRGYFYTPAGTLFSGPVTDGAAWTETAPGALPCLPGAASASGRPAGGQLAAYGSGSLVLACPAVGAGGGASGPGGGAGGAVQQETIYGSADGGRTWQRSGALTTAGPATSLAAPGGGVMVLGTGAGIDVSADNGAHWRQAHAGLPGGFSYVGMTYTSQGVAVPVNASLHEVWITNNGGQSWTPSPVTGGG